MFETLRFILTPATLTDPVGIPLGSDVVPFLIFFAVVLGVGIVIRVFMGLNKKLNPYLAKFLQKLAFVLMFWGVVEILYFLIREQKVGYLSSNLVFVLLTVLFLLWLIYVLAYRGMVYRKERAYYEAKQARDKYIPKRKKK